MFQIGFGKWEDPLIRCPVSYTHLDVYKRQPDDNANVAPVFADVAKTILTAAGAPTPPEATETVAQTKITPVPIATFLITCSYVSSYFSKVFVVVCPSSPRVNTYLVPSY